MTELLCPALAELPRDKADRAATIARYLQALYPDASCALDFRGDPFRLLVMARLSAQCTDQRVNLVSEPLFSRFPNVKAMADAPIEELEALVRPCGLYRTKAKQIRDAARILLEKHRGVIPRSKEELMALPGVGEKIANLMLGDVFDDPHIVADTHCIRLANRFALTDSKTPEKVTLQLEAIVPKPEQSDFCHRIILLGREFCKAQKPNCALCPFSKGKNAFALQ